MPFILLVFSLLIVAMYYINFTIRGSFSLFLGIYGTLMVIYLLGKQSLSFFIDQLQVIRFQI